MKLGIDILLASERQRLTNKRIGILAHQASQTSDGVHTMRRLLGDAAWKVTALFGPEHGLATRAQDMESVDSMTDPASGLPVYSLYGDTVESLSPTPEMLHHIDLLVVDLQDIGSRYYTYIWTMLLCMKACAATGKEVILCDRPNPIGGIELEGQGIAKGFESFVGMISLPVRHGMTMGELANLLNVREKIGCNLTVIPMEGWTRTMHWPDTGIPWVNPSPNMRSYVAALLYPGMCLLEGINCSEGRGTETPFELIGAPYIDASELIGWLTELSLPGIAAESSTFTPTFQKHAGRKCHGIRWAITDPQKFRPYLTGLALLWALFKLYKSKGIAWRTEPYEFVRGIPAIDLLTGSDAFRKRITASDFQEIVPLTDLPSSYATDRQPFLLYRQ